MRVEQTWRLCLDGDRMLTRPANRGTTNKADSFVSAEDASFAIRSYISVDRYSMARVAEPSAVSRRMVEAALDGW